MGNLSKKQNKQKTAFISGCSGQDGAYLAKYLLSKGYEVYGGLRRSASGSLWRLDYLEITDQVNIVEFELTDQENINNVIEDIQPDEFYNLAAMSHVGSSFKVPLSTIDITGMGPIRIITALKRYSPKTRFYQASTSELFGSIQEEKQNEDTPFYPRSPYAVAKQMAHWFGINYRESYGMYIVNGILFNHESPLRGSQFVTKKITEYVARYTENPLIEPLELGNMAAKRDWGHAKDYVRAMHAMLQQEEPEDFVVATGETHSVKEFVQQAFRHIGVHVKWKGEGLEEVGESLGKVIVKVNPKFYRPAEVEVLLGDPAKIKKKLKWEPSFTFSLLVRSMVYADADL